MTERVKILSTVELSDESKNLNLFVAICGFDFFVILPIKYHPWINTHILHFLCKVNFHLNQRYKNCIISNEALYNQNLYY